MGSLFSVGIPAAMSLLLFDLCNIVINRLAPGHGDIELAAIGIVLKAERLPLNIGIGICLGMTPLAAYNYASKNHKRMKDFFRTVRFGTQFLQSRCFATPFMFLSFHMVHFMQAVDRGKVSFNLAVIRQLCLNIPILFLMNMFFGMSGIVWTQLTADIINVVISYVIHLRLIGDIAS